jgi:SAM-dependent methyltransferase
MKPSGPNAQQIEYWNEVGGPKWVALEALLDAQIAPLGEELLGRAAPTPGERVIDVGCGCGSTSLELARRVGPGGEVVGVDISAPMIERAAARGREAGLANLRFENVDAQTRDFSRERFDLVFSRFGVMFFADPAAAFANLRAALRPGGRLAFVCWQSIQRNPWMLVPLGAAARHVALPAPPSPTAPGPFAFADAERVGGLLREGGFGSVAFEPLERVIGVGGDGSLEQAVEFLLQMGPAAAALRDADPSVLPKVRQSVLEAIAPFHRSDPAPGVRMPCAAWIVTARRDAPASGS